MYRGPDRKIAPAFDRHSPICIACGACQVVCPTNVIDLDNMTRHEVSKIKSEYDMDLANRPSVYIPFPQAIPKVAVIDRDTCLHYLTSKEACASCANYCEAEAINYDMEDKVEELDVGAVIVSPGFELFDADLKKELGYDRYPNVISGLQFERLLSASGPHLGKILRPSDEKAPKKIAFIQCVGCREADRDYCSSVCCMYATKEAIIAMEHEPGLECTIFFIDLRAFGKGFDAYYNRAKELGVKYVRCRPSTIKEVPDSKNLIVRYRKEDGEVFSEDFEMVVLSTALRPMKEVDKFASTFGIELDNYGFAKTKGMSSVETGKDGVYVCGPFAEPKDIPETVMEASAAASGAMALLNEERGKLIKKKEYPPEKDVRGQEPRIGVFVCHCGRNIGGVADVPSLVDYVKDMPNVVFATDNLYTCSTDAQVEIKKAIEENDLNRVVVASCTPRTHEPLFRDTVREAGLNPYLFEMANIRDQCTWVHMHEPDAATDKARDLIRMTLAKSRLDEPVEERHIDINHSALVIGGGLSGMEASLNLARQGFDVHLVEKEQELGGHMRHINYLLGDQDPQQKLKDVIQQVSEHPQVHVHAGSTLTSFEGFYGNFLAKIKNGNGEQEIEHGAVIVATGADEYQPTEHLYGKDKRVVTQREFEEKLTAGELKLDGVKSVVMIQCVGSRNDERPYCSRICCQTAIKNALKIKELSPETDVTILYRDIRTYGLREQYYTKARENGVRFIRFEEKQDPEVSANGGGLAVKVKDQMLGVDVSIHPDLLVLSAGIVPRPDTEEIGKLLKVSLTQDKFFLEAHLKLRPIDFASEGIYLCGLAHSPKTSDESISQAQGAAGRAATILAKDKAELEGAISQVIDENCDGCAYCVDPCPYDAITLIEYMKEGQVKKTVDNNEAKCKGCGVCMATCPKKGIFIRHFKLEQLSAMVEAALNE
jgi:heterodisulfide reductase subunit A